MLRNYRPSQRAINTGRSRTKQKYSLRTFTWSEVQDRSSGYPNMVVSDLRIVVRQRSKRGSTPLLLRGFGLVSLSGLCGGPPKFPAAACPCEHQLQSVYASTWSGFLSCKDLQNMSCRIPHAVSPVQPVFVTRVLMERLLSCAGLCRPSDTAARIRTEAVPDGAQQGRRQPGLGQ